LHKGELGELGKVYNIGAMNAWNNIDICLATGRPVHDWHDAIDAMKINTKSGRKPVQIFETGIHKTIEWSLHAIK